MISFVLMTALFSLVATARGESGLVSQDEVTTAFSVFSGEHFLEIVSGEDQQCFRDWLASAQTSCAGEVEEVKLHNS